MDEVNTSFVCDRVICPSRPHPQHFMNDLADRIVAHLSDDLRRAPWKGSENPLAGHCYVASEAYYHLAGGKAAGFVAMRISHEGSTHWYLRGPEGYIDLTEGQFQTPVEHSLGVATGFLTSAPSKRAQTLTDRLNS